MKRIPRKALLTAAGAGVSAGAWGLALRSDRRRVESDPAYQRLNALGAGRPLNVTSFDGTRLHAEEFGPSEGPLFVLAHGWTCALRFWSIQIQDLAAGGAGGGQAAAGGGAPTPIRHRVVAYDLRGHGRSGRPQQRDYTIDAHGDDLAAVLQAACRPGERAVLAGHSLGGMTVVSFASRHPELLASHVAAAALCNTGMGDLISEAFVVRAPDPLKDVQSMIGRVILSVEAPMPKKTTPISHRLVRYVALSPQASSGEVAFSEEITLGTPHDVRAACGGTLTELDLHHAVESLTVPTAVVAGERDRLTPLVHSERLARDLPQLTELLVLPGSGHMGPVTEPDQVTALLAGLARDHLTSNLQESSA